MYTVTAEQAQDLLEGTEYILQIYNYFGVLPDELVSPYNWVASDKMRTLTLMRDDDTVWTFKKLNMCKIRKLPLLPRRIEMMLNGLI